MTTRIAILGSRGYPSTYSGFETLVGKLSPYLAHRGYDVTVYCRQADVHKTDRPADIDMVHQVFTRGWNSKTASTLSFGLTSALHARNVPYDAALVVNIANGYFLPLLRSARIPTAVNVDGLEWARAKWNLLGKEVFRYGAKATARWANRIIIDSEALRPVWGGQFPVEATFIPYGAEVVHGVDDTPVRNLGFEPGRYILAVARLVPENNLDVLLDAARHLPASVPIVIVGSGPQPSPLISRLTAAVAMRSNLRWLGHVADQALLGALWAHCGAYWHGHSVGGTNPSLLQALGFGSPTLALDTVFNREVLSPHDRHLIPADPKLLAKRIEQLLEDSTLAEEFSRAGQEIVGTRYQWDDVCSSYAQVLDSLALRNQSR